MAEMRLLMEYFSLFDGKQKWEDIEPKIQETFHPNLTVKDGRETFSRQAFVEKLRSFVESGGSMEVLKLKKFPTGIQYKLVFHQPGQPNKPTKSFGAFENGLLVKVQRDTARRAVAVL